MKSINYKILEWLPEKISVLVVPYFNALWEPGSRWILFLVFSMIVFLVSSNAVFTIFCLLLLFFIFLISWDFYRTPILLIPKISNSRSNSVIRQKEILPHQLEYLVEWITEQRYTSLFLSELQEIRNSSFKNHKSISAIHLSTNSTLWTCAFPIFQKYNQKLNCFLCANTIDNEESIRDFWPVIHFNDVSKGGNIRKSELERLVLSPFVEIQHLFSEPINSKTHAGLQDFKELENLINQPITASFSESGNYEESYLDYHGKNRFAVTYSPFAYSNNKDFPDLFSVIKPVISGIYLFDIISLRLQLNVAQGHVYLAPISTLLIMIGKYLIPQLWKWNLDRKIKSLNLLQILRSWTKKSGKRRERSANQN